MISIISLNLRTDIIRIVSPTLRTESTQTFRSKQLFRHNIKHLFFLCPVQRRIIKSNGKYHIGTDAPVHHKSIYIIEQITAFITEYFNKGLPGYFSLSIQFICQMDIASFREPAVLIQDSYADENGLRSYLEMIRRAQ